MLPEGSGGHTNGHAYLLITTGRIEGDQLPAKKARDLDPEVRRAGTRALVTDAEAWGETWRVHQDRYFQENAIEGLHEEFKRRIKTKTVLPSAETAAMLFWALLASGQITMRKVNGWQSLGEKFAAPIPVDLAA